MTTRRGKQFNSMVFSKNDSIQGGKERDDVIMSEADAQQLHLKEGDKITLHNGQGCFSGRVRLMEMASGCIQTYWSESNILIPRCYDPLSEEPDYNCLVQISKGWL